ncbi:MAG TPA: hypothetical protein VLT45_01570, partial [Kofleriaceae bacterium]|nr:hypothetical protein [Kofleriaceae bacterium]
MKKLLLLALVAACTRGEHREARAKYNEGITLLQNGDYDGAEKALLEARSNAGVDPELRYRAAYDLGMAYAAHADKVKKDKDGDLAKALELEQQAVSWFSDAVKLRKDGDAQANLATVRARAQAMSDELRRAEGKLEARLDKTIGEQRKILEGARAAWVQIKEAGGADPLAQQGALTQLADQERGIVAEVGTIGDIADDEIDSIGKKPEDKRSPEEKARVVQLKNLDIYILDARARIAEARRKLQDLAAEDAVARSEAALVALKRAREQLLEPIDVLREVAGDEMNLFQETSAVAQVDSGKLAGSAAEPAPLIPAWMEPPVLGDRQGGLRDRVEEVRTRVQAASEHTNDAQLKPEQKKVLQMYVDALPFVTDASTAMDRAHTALSSKKLGEAQAAEKDALVALSKAIERFADLKQTIDLASDTQKQLVRLLSPEGAKIPDRAATAKDALDANVARMTRIKDLIAEQLAQVAEQQKQLDAAGSGSGAQAQQVE